jgi:hypothetical protein
VVAGITAYFQPGRTVDVLFTDCLQLIVEPPGTAKEEIRA